MEFMSRSRGPQPAPGHAPQHHQPKKGLLERVEILTVLWGVALILILLAVWAAFGGTSVGESKKIKNDKFQAVFLNGGVTSGSVTYSTYFGHITKLNDKYLVLNNVYYLTDTSGSSGQAGNPQLTKLGCQQLHSPYDEMIVNRSQVAFWENLQDSGKVVQAIKTFQQQNPNGPNCSQSSSSSTPQSSTAPANSTSQTTTGGTSTQKP
jgi:hypothetical protein